VKTQAASCDKSTTGDINLLQANISGIQNRAEELLRMLNQHNIHIALIQETIPPKKEVNISGYTQHRCQCKKCQGIMTLVRNNVQAEVTNTSEDQDKSIDTQKITYWVNKTKYTFYNNYCPPTTEERLNYEDTTYQKTIIAGDFNAHSPSWGYKDYNTRGRDIEEICNTTNMILKQNSESEPTLLHRASGTTSRPDLTMVSADISDRCKCTVLEDIGSDHKPILITIQAHKITKPKQKTLWNFLKANWTAYAKLTDNSLEKINMTDTVEDIYNNITQCILQAAKTTIPRGCRRRYKNFWNPTLEKTIKERQEARKQVEKDPSRINKTLYNKLTTQTRNQIKTAKKETWTRTCGNLDMRTKGYQAWKLLHNIDGKQKKFNPKPIRTGGKVITESKKKAELFNKYYAKVSKTEHRKQLDKGIKKITKQEEKAAKVNIALFDTAFTNEEMNIALKKIKKRKAPGLDKTTNEMLLHLGTKAKSVLLNFINKTWNESNIPKAWRTANIKPIQKKHKQTNEPSDYRPVSLTSSVGKLAERMVNHRLYRWLECNRILDNCQAGFRKGCRTEDQLFYFTQKTMDAFQDGKHTTAVFIDLQQAYDTVWRQGLFNKMAKMGIHGKMYFWIKAFLTNRTIQTTVENCTSSKKTLEEGLPQGSALSATLFLIHINDLPPLLQVLKPYM
jgi:hypothetical protein